MRTGGSRWRALLAASLAAAALGVTFLPAVALADVFSPESSSGSPNAVNTDSLYKLALGVGVVIFVGVEGVLYDYPRSPGELFSYHDMIVPVETNVLLDITSADVDHSWWVPALGGKADAVPGHVKVTRT